MQSAMCDVLWDRPFIGGATMDGLVPERRGYRIPQYSLLNLGKYKKLKEAKAKSENAQKAAAKKEEEKNGVSNGNRDYNRGSPPVIEKRVNSPKILGIKSRFVVTKDSLLSIIKCSLLQFRCSYFLSYFIELRNLLIL